MTAMPAVFADQVVGESGGVVVDALQGGVGEVTAVEWHSSWEYNKQVTDGSSQTSDPRTVDVGTSQTEHESVGVQTDPVVTNSGVWQHDELPPGCAEAVKAVADVMIAALDANIVSHAFDGYDVQWESELRQVSCEHTLHHEALAGSDLQCVAVDWNATGAVVVAAYGRVDDVESWYAHKSTICSWNIDRYFMAPTKADSAIEMPSCVGSLSCHPERPPLLVCGLYNGAVVVLDMSRTSGQEVIFRSAPEQGHTEPVMHVSWVARTDARRQTTYMVVSMAGDGKVLCWGLPKEHKHDGKLVLLSRYAVKGSDIRLSQKGSKAGSGTEAGLSALGLYSDGLSEPKFVVGTETGGLLQCTLATARPTDSGETSPVLMGHTPHVGSVYGLSYSPFHRNLFLSCSSDGSARIYNALSRKPVMMADPGLGYLLDAAWSRHRPSVFAVASASGKIALYDLAAQRGSVTPAVTLVANENGASVYGVAFNPKKSRYLATGDAQGIVKVWALSDELIRQGHQEVEVLDALANDIGSE
eukprot:m.454021 g.454021  ORF g.454021 m.454021 type:complete len:528 (-) comp20601_c0_seq1:185-1768(-)